MTSLIETVDEKRIIVRESVNILTGETRLELIPEEVDLEAPATSAGIAQEAILYLFNSGEVARTIFQHLGIVLTAKTENEHDRNPDA